MFSSSTTRPSSVRILGRTYNIHYLPASPLQNSLMGQCDNISQQIIAEDGMTPIEEADTVLHEVLHGLCYTLKLGLDAETEERVVGTLATGLLGVLQDNPDFGAYLLEDKSNAD